ncbi:hypothetical protein AAXB25_14945 [Paenibacillus lautus]|uniref:hypothetical protein n=1 Tax=Paenibacillus lautus TaxID=1401 RepID=UPI003D2D0957
MSEEALAYLNANVHKIAQFKTDKYAVYIEMVNGDVVRIYTDIFTGKQVIEHKTGV